jgi:hypothetical protein
MKHLKEEDEFINDDSYLTNQEQESEGYDDDYDQESDSEYDEEEDNSDYE